VTKERRTVSISEENDEYLSDHPNASDLVDELVRKYRDGADKGTAAIEVQLEQKREELRAAKRDVERIEQNVAELEQLKAELSRTENAQIAEAKRELSSIEGELDPTNPAVQNWAEKIGMTPAELIAEIA